ncbi:MAG: hypothetical protein A2452_07955 [Candidatus Firestonebacteria bacterium RIFOXYC2_FULL_39_67]|nr:MAG: hypothetical protein A2536_08110 [Candidatus Firestonebacteria bacterium RIFOXYD2_FULL_39_29]OGF54490.1 MAG: hypothetical protein A2497_07480 [Candidatus Firestonebacteria bacterium RifOxyC12_full_39_7]OGF56775.1 MAG: hypothetical protein A2452_07955 [Candidatus Firestonebacteria bacterium RIFOXYC2_FULL_39_67]
MNLIWKTIGIIFSLLIVGLFVWFMWWAFGIYNIFILLVIAIAFLFGRKKPQNIPIIIKNIVVWGIFAVMTLSMVDWKHPKNNILLIVVMGSIYSIAAIILIIRDNHNKKKNDKAVR